MTGLTLVCLPSWVMVLPIGFAPGELPPWFPPTVAGFVVAGLWWYHRWVQLEEVWNGLWGQQLQRRSGLRWG